MDILASYCILLMTKPQAWNSSRSYCLICILVTVEFQTYKDGDLSFLKLRVRTGLRGGVVWWKWKASL